MPAARSTPAIGDPPRKALYLATSTPLRIDCEGESLLLRRAAQATARYPLARIDRILCNRHADWSGEALARCLRHGIPLVWVDGHGQALGSASPRLGRVQPFDALVDSYLERADWRSRYDNWLKRRRLDILVLTALRAVQAGHALTQAEFDEHKRAYVYKGELDAVFPEFARAWCHAYVLKQLAIAGIAATLWGYDGQPLDFGDDLCGLLWAELNLEAASLAAAADQTRTQLLLVESWIARHPACIPEHLARFRRHLAHENQQWP
jgi:hypothetical protein